MKRCNNSVKFCYDKVLKSDFENESNEFQSLSDNHMYNFNVDTN